MLDRKEAFNIMHGPNPFSIEYCQLDLKKETGGKKQFYPSVTLAKQSIPLSSGEGHEAKAFGKSKKPNHRNNLTLNIQLPGQQIRKVHVPLILKINGESVL